MKPIVPAVFIQELILNFKSEFRSYSKKVSILALTNSGTQIISIISFIFISRVYSVSSIGDYVTYIAYVAILSILSTGNYDQALYVEKRHRLFKKLISLAFVCIFIFSFLAGGLLFLFGVDYAFYIALAMIASGVLKTSTSMNIVNNRLIFTSTYLFIVSPLLPLLIIFNGKYVSQEVGSMIMIHASTSFLISILFFLISSKWQLNLRVMFLRTHWVQLLWLGKRYKKYLGFSTFGELIGSSSLRIPIFIANEYFTKQLAAYYGVVFRLAIAPITFILGNVSQIFMQKISHNRKNNIPSLNLYLQYIVGLSFLSVCGCTFILLFGHDLIVLALTEKYEMVAILLIEMLPYIFMLSVISPLTSVLGIFEKQEYAFYNKIAFFICSAVSFGYGAYVQDFIIAVKSFSIGMTAIYMVIFWQVFIILKNNKEDIVKKGFHLK